MRLTETRGEDYRLAGFTGTVAPTRRVRTAMSAVQWIADKLRCAYNHHEDIEPGALEALTLARLEAEAAVAMLEGRVPGRDRAEDIDEAWNGLEWYVGRELDKVPTPTAENITACAWIEFGFTFSRATIATFVHEMMEYHAMQPPKTEPAKGVETGTTGAQNGAGGAWLRDVENGITEREEAADDEAEAERERIEELQQLAEQRKREFTKGIFSALVLPESLNTPEFRAELIEWISYRKRKGHKAGSWVRFFQHQVSNVFEPHGVRASIAAIHRARNAGWTGVFPENEHATGPVIGGIPTTPRPNGLSFLGEGGVVS